MIVNVQSVEVSSVWLLLVRLYPFAVCKFPVFSAKVHVSFYSLTVVDEAISSQLVR